MRAIVAGLLVVAFSAGGDGGRKSPEQYKRKLGPADDEMVIAQQLLRSKASD